EESNSFSYLIWDKDTEDAVIIDPVRNQVSRDIIASTNLHLLYAINTHVHEDRFSGGTSLKKKIKWLKTVISRPSKAEADQYIDDGDEIHFGNRHIVALATPGHTSGCMSFLLDDGKAVLTGDTLLVDGYGPVLASGSARSFFDSLFHKLLILPDSCIVLPGHDFGGGLHSTIGHERSLIEEQCGNMEDFVQFVNRKSDNNMTLPKENMIIASNMKDGATPFNLRSLRTRVKHRWGIFG
ncbi:hypothetical protein ACHAXR_008317, partial [Thalassiosira sp. AJA248-18]